MGKVQWARKWGCRVCSFQSGVGEGLTVCVMNWEAWAQVLAARPGAAAYLEWRSGRCTWETGAVVGLGGRRRREYHRFPGLLWGENTLSSRWSQGAPRWKLCRETSRRWAG